ncbi:MAG: helix-turn-helix protein [Myxococcaceae bacterium]|nr:helix-turn-helix protein [Myxococcaceae bacterium]
MSNEGTIRVTAAQRRRLQAIVQGAAGSARVRLRATVILLSAEGTGGEQIARALGITRRTVTNTRARWRERGLAGLAEGARSGRPPLATASYRAKLRATVECDPRTLGYAFTRWTAPRLAAYLAKVTGVHLSTPRLLRVLHREKFVWRRTKRTLRNLQEPSEIASTHRLLKRLKKGLSSSAVTSNSGTATG